jgi:hypothetical protein
VEAMGKKVIFREANCYLNIDDDDEVDNNNNHNNHNVLGFLYRQSNDIWRLGAQGQKSHCCRPINNVKYIIFHCLYSLVSFLLMSQLHYIFFPKGYKRTPTFI